MLWLYMNRLSRIEQLLRIIAVNAVVLALVGVGFRLMHSDKILGLAEPVHPAFFASFRYHNHWTGYAVLAMGCCAALTCFVLQKTKFDTNFRRQRKEFIWIGALFLLTLTLPMTTARAGVLLMALFWFYLAFRLALVFAVSRSGASSGGGGFKLKRLLVPLASLSVVGAVVVFAIWSSAPSLRGDWEQTKQQLAQLQAGETGEIDWARTDSWGDGWRMFKDRPVWGWGFGSHRYLYQLYAREEYRRPDGTVKHIKEFAHNDWMQYLAELGLVGCLLLAAPVLWIAWQTRRCWLQLNSPAHWILLSAGLILLLATFEFPLSNPGVLTHFVVLVGLALKIAWLERARDRVCGTDAT
jgi:O-antigen ligase